MSTDIWHSWLLNRRHAGDSPYVQFLQGKMSQVCDRILNGAQLAAGMTLVDVGAGEGLIGLGAIARLGPSMRVMFTDLSAPLLQYVQALATEMGVQQQCSFFHCSAEKLGGIGDGAADVVAMRSVLTYVPDKRAAVSEFHRVLKPGGRVSIAEPIFQDQALEN